MEESKEELEVKVSAAMRERLDDFKRQADTLTLEVVRRVIEEDLGLEKFSLDAHKKFVKQWIDKHFYGPAEPDITKTSEVKLDGTDESGEKKRKSESPKHPDKESNDKKAQDVALGKKEAIKKESETTEIDETSEDSIKKAIKKRAVYFRENSENITMAEVRRLLEEDLKLARNSLYKYKELIKAKVSECLDAEPEKPVNGAKKGKANKSTPNEKKSTSSKMTKRKKEEESESSDLSGSEGISGSEDMEEEDAPSQKKFSHVKGKAKPLKKQKVSAKKSKPASSGKKSAMEEKDTSDKENEASASDDNDDRSSSSAEESSKKSRDKPAPVYGKKVEHLKSVIKSCGMSIPPSIYKKAKDAPESKREAILLKELEGILEREGLSRNPSEKEIKALKKRKERAKELEGIDMSNIVVSSRRRTASSYIPPKPQIPLESEEEEDEEEDDEEETDDENSGVSSEGSEEDADDGSD